MDALHIVAQKADGALRDALSIYDQIVSFSGNTITYQSVIDNLNILDYDYYFKFADFANKEQIQECLLLLNEIVDKGFDLHNVIVGLAEHFRNLLVAKEPKTVTLLEVSDEVKEKYVAQAKEMNVANIMRSLGVLSQADVQYKASKNQRLLVELGLMQICSIKQELEKKNS
jgi:DNA polymerase III subunit gamma/tau